MDRPRIAVINDDPVFLELLQDFIQDARQYDVDALQQGMGAVDRLRSLTPDVVVIDIRLEYGRLGYHILEAMRRDNQLCSVPVIVCTADSRFLDEYATRLAELNVDTLAKPFDLDDLLDKLDAALKGTRKVM
jgi:DNA-binding response OmpR family regulator